MFALKPDFEQVMDRYEAWWEAQVLDRPLVSMTFARPAAEQVASPPAKAYATPHDHWMDTGRVVAQSLAYVRNQVFFADALPMVWPNLGPEVFSAMYGCPMDYVDDRTGWSEPILADWSPESVAALRLDEDNLYFRKILEMTEALLEVARGQFIVGYTDLHPGGDAIAAFRDPQQLCLDVLEYPEEVKALNERITDDFLRLYEVYHQKLSAAGMPSTSWLPAICRGRYHIPSNDFSCMVSDQLFADLFLPGLVRECSHMDRCIYHLDGPQALRYLDTLLELPQIHAIQWVPGAGHDHWADWVPVYRRIQEAGKAFCLGVPAAELDQLFAALRPEGAWLTVSGIADLDSAQAALKAISRWKG